MITEERLNVAGEYCTVPTPMAVLNENAVPSLVYKVRPFLKIQLRKASHTTII